MGNLMCFLKRKLTQIGSCPDKKNNYDEEGQNPDHDKKNGLPQRWKLLSGQNHWEGMLKPLDPELRQYLLHYGSMARATYNAFNYKQEFKHAGGCKYTENEFFSNVGIEKGNHPFKYKVTKYFYATSSIEVPNTFIIESWSREAWNKESNWMGFVALATDEGKKALGRRDILIGWRGTVQHLEWGDDFRFLLVPAPDIFGGNEYPRVHSGWHSIYTLDDPRSPFNKTSARHQVLEEVGRLVEQYKNEEVSISITGHSLGAAISTLNAVDIVVNGYNKPRDMPHKAFPVTAFLFASPRVGDENFRVLFENLQNINILRVTNVRDVVPNCPSRGIGYTDVGEELVIDTAKSSFLNIGNFSSWHSLETYLHGIAGRSGNWKLEAHRDTVLVDKHIWIG